MVIDLEYYAPNISSVWENLEQPEKIADLIWGAYIMRYLRWRGKPKYRNQALSFPRIIDDTDVGIPDVMKQVQLFCAVYLAEKGRSQYPSSDTELSDGTKAKSVSVAGMFSVTAADKPTTPSDPWSAANLERMLKDRLWPIYLSLEPYLVQFRIRKVRTLAEIAQEDVLWTTTTSSTSTTTTT